MPVEHDPVGHRPALPPAGAAPERRRPSPPGASRARPRPRRARRGRSRGRRGPGRCRHRRRRSRAPSSRRSPRPAGRAAGRAAGPGSTCARCPAGPAGRGRRSAPRSASSARLWSGVFPNPKPGSTIRSSHGDAGGDGAVEGRAAGRRRPRPPRRGSAPPRGCASARSGRRGPPRAGPWPGPSATPQTSLSEVGAGIEGGLGDGRRSSCRPRSAWPAARRRRPARPARRAPARRRTGTGAWPGRLEAPPTSSRSAPSSTIRRAWSTAAPTGSAAASSPSPEKESGVDVEHAHHERPGAPRERRRSDGHRRRRAGRASPTPLVPLTSPTPLMPPPGRAARDRPPACARATPTRYSDPATTTGPSPVRSARSRAVAGSASTSTAAPGRRRPPGRGERPRPAAPAARRAAVHTTVAPASGRAGRDRRDDRRHVLVGHGRPDQHRRPRRSGVAAREIRAQVVERRREGGGAVGVVGAVEQHLAPAPVRRIGVDQLEPAGPARRRVALPPRRVGDAGEPGGLEPVQQRVRDRDVGGLVAAAERHLGRSQPGQRHPLRVPGPVEDRRRLDDRERHPQARRPAADHREGLAGRRRSPRRRRAR